MLKTIIIHEIQNHIYSLRFFFALILTLFLFGVSSVSYTIEFKEQKKVYEQSIAKIEGFKKNVAKNASSFAQNMNVFPFAPRNTGFISLCGEGNIPNTIIYTAYNVYGFDMVKGDNNPFVLPTKTVNWEFIIVFLFSFLAIIFTFDTVSGEKETRTLALGLSNSVSRGVILTGKFLGTVIILGIFLLFGIILSLLILMLSAQVSITIVTIYEIFVFFLMATLLIASTTAIGILTSVLSHKSNTSLLSGLTIWLVFMFVLPHTTLLLSNKLFPVEKSNIIDENCQNSRKTIEASFPDGKWHSEGNNPFTPDHQIRANMQMSFMLDEKKIKDNWYNSLFNQYEKTSKLTCISPMFIFESGNEQILNGGYQRFKKNWDDLHTYQVQFLAWFKAFDAKDDKSPHWYNPYEDYSTSKKEIKIEEVPVYTEKIITIGQRIRKTGVYIALLLIYTTIVFFVSFVLFVRYDVR